MRLIGIDYKHLAFRDDKRHVCNRHVPFAFSNQSDAERAVSMPRKTVRYIAPNYTVERKSLYISGIKLQIALH